MQSPLPPLQAEAQRGIAALQRGDFATARHALSQVTASNTASAQAWLFYAQACEGCGDWDNVLLAAQSVLTAENDNPFALFMMGDAYRRVDDRPAAVAFYRKAIRRCMAADHLPGDLSQRLGKARDYVEHAEHRFNNELAERLAKDGITKVPPRLAEALAIASGKQPIYLQEPTSFYFPGLPQRAWYEPDEFTWAAELEAAVPAMRAEIENVLADERGMQPYVEEQAGRPSRGHDLLNDPRWSAFHLWKDGSRVAANASRCPLVMQLLELAPMPRINGRSPMALISLLRPGTHITPHTGMLNTRLICHIPIVVPAGCRLRVGGETREVTAGRAMIFDDSIEHEAWNDGGSNRAVLLFEIWRPEISQEERLALTAMFEAASGYGASGDA